MEDLLEVNFVIGSQCPCTVLDLERWRAYADNDKCESDNDIPDKTPLSMLDTYAFFSEEAEKMKEAIRRSALETDVPCDRLSTRDEREVMYNDIMQKLTHVQDDCSISEQRMKDLKSGFETLVENMYNVVLEDKERADIIDDGNGRIVFYGQPDNNATQHKRKRRAT